jgi:outer membrane receptor protein involved in Fe transport
MQLKAVLVLFLAACVGTIPLFGVGTTGTIVGTVKDNSGGVVANAEVTVRNQETNATRHVKTNETGDYTVPLLPPGTYEVVVQNTGFRRAVSKDIALAVDQTVRVDVTLQIGEMSQEVAVAAAAPLVQTDSSTIGQVVEGDQVKTLPLNERNFVAFALLVPGAQLPSEGSLDSTQGQALSVNGARETANNFLLDGVDNQDLVINQYSVLPMTDAIEQFKVQSSTYSAEFGRSGGAQINVVLKSGTNQFHGEAFEFLRNRHLDAKNFFDLPNCTSASLPGSCAGIPRLDRSQLGGTFGGPIIRDKTFFFVAYELLHLREATTRQATVPSQAQIAAALAAVSAAQRNTAGVNILNLYPAANVGTDLQTSNLFVASPVIKNREQEFVVKVDHHINDKNTLSGHFALSYGNRFSPYDLLAPFTNLPGYGTTVITQGQNGGGTWTHVFNTRLVNELRVGYNKERGFFSQTDKTDHNKALGFPDVLTKPVDLGFPNVSIAGFDGIGQPTNTPQDHPTTTLHIADNLAWNPAFMGGRHQFKFGFEMRPYWYNLLFDIIARGLWTFNGGPAGNPNNPTQNPLIQLLQGTPDFALGVSGDSNMVITTTSYGAYVQDDYRLSPHFTLNLGLRYEYNSPPVEIHNKFSDPDLTPNALTCTPKPNCQFIVAGTPRLSRGTYPPDKTDFAPRVGFAWRPLGTDRFVVRSGYGIFYDLVILNANLESELNPPFFSVVFFSNNSTNSLTIQNILNQAPGSNPAQPSFMSPNFKDAYMQQWNLDVQYELKHDVLLDVAYVGSKGTRLIIARDINQSKLGGTPPFPAFGGITMNTSEGDSSYHALQVRSEKRTSRGLAFLASYTFSKSLDDASGLFGTRAEPGYPQNSFDLSADRGLSNFNVKHRFVFSSIYELPFGTGQRWLAEPGIANRIFGNWKISGILALQSGQPFTVNRGVDQSGTGTIALGTIDRPNLVGNPNVGGPVAANLGCIAPAQVHTVADWFNPCAFAAAPGKFGSAGRNFLIGPDYKDVDFSVLRDIHLGRESRLLQFRAEFFNLFNHPNFDLPSSNFDGNAFGALQSANAFGGRPPRQVQLGLKFLF